MDPYLRSIEISTLILHNHNNLRSANTATTRWISRTGERSPFLESENKQAGMLMHAHKVIVTGTEDFELKNRNLGRSINRGRSCLLDSESFPPPTLEP